MAEEHTQAPPEGRMPPPPGASVAEMAAFIPAPAAPPFIPLGGIGGGEKFPAPASITALIPMRSNSQCVRPLSTSPNPLNPVLSRPPAPQPQRRSGFGEGWICLPSRRIAACLSQPSSAQTQSATRPPRPPHTTHPLRCGVRRRCRSRLPRIPANTLRRPPWRSTGDHQPSRWFHTLLLVTCRRVK